MYDIFIIICTFACVICTFTVHRFQYLVCRFATRLHLFFCIDVHSLDTVIIIHGYLCLCIALLYKSSLHYIKCIQFTPFVEWEVGNVKNCHSVLVVRPYDLPRYTIAITERDNIAKFLYGY